jgi:hypothetical protein
MSFGFWDLNLRKVFCLFGFVIKTPLHERKANSAILLLQCRVIDVVFSKVRYS